jgi:hypothetical protein
MAATSLSARHQVPLASWGGPYMYKNQLFDFFAGSAGFQPAGKAKSGLEARAPRECCLKIKAQYGFRTVENGSS